MMMDDRSVGSVETWETEIGVWKLVVIISQLSFCIDSADGVCQLIVS